MFSPAIQAAISVTSAPAGESSYISCTDTSYTMGYVGVVGAEAGGGFITPDANINVSQLSFYLKIAEGNPTSYSYTAKIYSLNVSNAITGTLGTSSSVSGSTLTSSFQVFEFTFLSSVALSSGTKYGIAVVQGTANNSNSISIGAGVDCDDTSIITYIGKWNTGTGAWSEVATNRGVAGEVLIV